MKFRKKPVVIDAMQWTGNNASELQEFARGGEFSWNPIKAEAYIHTLEGVMTTRPGDWIIKGVKGEFYPCKPDIFEATYEAA